MGWILSHLKEQFNYGKEQGVELKIKHKDRINKIFKKKE